jgi:hypothetical protein
MTFSRAAKGNSQDGPALAAHAYVPVHGEQQDKRKNIKARLVGGTGHTDFPLAEPRKEERNPTVLLKS